MGKYFLENVHAKFPRARCVLLVGSRKEMIRDLFAAYSWLEVLEVNRRNVRGVLRAYADLRGMDVSLTQYAENPFSLPSKLFARAVTKKGGMFGFDDRSAWNTYLYDTVIPFAGEDKSEGMIVEEQKALKAANIGVEVPQIRLSYIEDTQVFSRFGLEPQKYVAVHLFSGSEGRSISQKKRLEIIQSLRKTIPTEIKIVLTGAKGESSLAEETLQDLYNVFNLAGKTTIQELINILASARVVVSLDSGAAHIAAQVGAPLVVLTRKAALTAWWGQSMYQGKPHVLCNTKADDSSKRTGPNPPSLETIDPQELLATVAKLI
jgi:ADP-heptose:LPS heptosyltransferase